MVYGISYDLDNMETARSIKSYCYGLNYTSYNSIVKYRHYQVSQRLHPQERSSLECSYLRLIQKVLLLVIALLSFQPLVH